MSELETAANRALENVETGEGRFDQFMDLVTQVAQIPGNHHEFVDCTAPAIARQSGLTTPLGRWAGRIARAVGFGNEDDAIGAVGLRTQLEFACELYRNSVAFDALNEQRDHETDDALRELANDFGIAPGPEIPRSHRWWRWPASE